MGVTAEVTAMAVATGLVGAAAAMVAARKPTTSAPSIVVRAGLAVAALSLLGAVGTFLKDPFGTFATAHFLYLVAVVAVPMTAVGVAVVAARGWPERRWLGVAALVLLIPAPVGVWATHVAPFRLREDRVALQLASGRTLDRPLRIAVLSDMQNIGITGYEEAAVDRVMAQDPDVILIAGDLFQGNAAQLAATLPRYRALLDRLQAPGGVFIVRGDTDGGAFDQIVDGTSVTALEDEVTTTDVDGQRVVIGGVRLGYWAPQAQPVYDELEATRSTDPVILLAHRPDAVSELHADSRVDLTVAGHTHGGQIAMPLVGPLITLSDLPRSVGAGGLHQVDGNAIYVSTGIGLERDHAPQIRFLTRPSFGIIEVTAPAA